MRENEENLEYMKEVMGKLKSSNSAPAETGKPKRAAAGGRPASSSSSKGTGKLSGSKRKAPEPEPQEDIEWSEVANVIDPTKAAKKEITIPIPSNLRRFLALDWEKISHENMLLPLPRSPDVSTILDEYLKSKSSRKNPSSDKVYKKLVQGLRTYFDRTLPQRLLYPQEQLQFDEIMEQNPGKQPSEIYGAEHLLRLFGM
jgi:mortality factor 4-like protein 1